MAQQAEAAAEVASVRRKSISSQEIGRCGKNFKAPHSCGLGNAGGRDDALLCSTIT